METRFKGRVSWEELEEKEFQVLAGIHKIVLAWFVVAVRGFFSFWGRYGLTGQYDDGCPYGQRRDLA